jgi:hypothetical protein
VRQALRFVGGQAASLLFPAYRRMVRKTSHDDLCKLVLDALMTKVVAQKMGEQGNNTPEPTLREVLDNR